MSIAKLFLCVCRKVHHSGMGKEGNSVPWLRGETISTAEDPGWINRTFFLNPNESKIIHDFEFCILRTCGPLQPGMTAGLV